MNVAKVKNFWYGKYRCLPLFLVKLLCSVLFSTVHGSMPATIGQSA